VTDRSGADRRLSDLRLAEFARTFGEALRSGDSAQAERVMDDALLAGVPPVAIQALIIAPAMNHIGELWESNVISVADEHLATAISRAVLIRLFDALHVGRVRSRERLVIAAVEGQHHVLGLRMVADVLEGAGFDVMFLGSGVPLEGLRCFVVRHRPAVVGLGFNIAVDVGHLAEAILAIHEVSPEPRIMLGGRAVPPILRAAGYPFVESSLEVLPTVERMLTAPPQMLHAAVRALIPRAARSSRSTPEIGASDPVTERLAGAVVESADIAREYIRQSRMFRDLALRDPVTDLANRRAFDDRIYLQTHTGADGDALLMIDVDEFKQVNDTYGHDAGDRLLRLVGEAITQSIRPQDFAARIGGDEFAAILPIASLEIARQLGERVRQAIAAHAEPPISVSIGVAPLNSDGRAALLAADVALYRAKAAGRNRVAAVPQLHDVEPPVSPTVVAE
jgi:diguanylate cyclase (GGDEF)-like protein